MNNRSIAVMGQSTTPKNAPSLRPRRISVAAHPKSLVNVLGVVYLHSRTEDGGDLYLTRFAEPFQQHLAIKNWFEHEWFTRHRVRLLGTSSVYRVPTRRISGTRLDLVVKNSRVGEDVPLDTHTLEEFCNAEFNSPWEEFALVMEMGDRQLGQRVGWVKVQRPLGIYVPPQTMQHWQSGRSRAKINRIRARHPGIDLDILKQYKLVYEWIPGRNLIELFEHIKLDLPDAVHHLKAMQAKALEDLTAKGYLMADMKPEHVIIDTEDCERIERTAAPDLQVDMVHQIMRAGKYSVVDYELLFRTPEHEDQVKSARRHCYLDDQRDRMKPMPLPSHLVRTEIFGVPYLFGHAESTGGRMWVVGRNARLFDYFLPERWRKTPSLSLSDDNEVFYTVTKDNIHLVWETSRVGELPIDRKYTAEDIEKIRQHGINSPFEEFAIAHDLSKRGIHTVYVRAIYATGSVKVERSQDARKFASHRHLPDTEGNPILDEQHNYITIRGYYNGPDEWVPEHEGSLLTPMDLAKAEQKGMLTGLQVRQHLDTIVVRLQAAGYDGTLLKANDILLTVNEKGEIVQDGSGGPDLIICNFETLWKIADPL